MEKLADFAKFSGLLNFAKKQLVKNSLFCGNFLHEKVLENFFEPRRQSF